MKIFFVTPYAPNTIRVRPYNLIRNLAKRGNQVSLYTLYTDQVERDEINLLRGLCEVEAFEITRRESMVNSIKALPTRKPLQSVYSWQPKLAEKLLSDIVDKRPDVIHIEHLRGARYGMFIKSNLMKLMRPLPIVWDSVDCISDLFTQAVKGNSHLKQKILLWFELSRTRHFEKEAVGLFDGVLVTSPKDAQALKDLREDGLPDGVIHVIPNGVDLETFKPEDGIAREKETLIVSGKMSYHANIAMTQYLVNEIMPHIWVKRPGVKLWIVGKDPPREVQFLANDPLIQVTGMVSDIADYLRRATIAVAPLRYGAGIQNKILEAMACSTAVVTNNQAIGSLSARNGEDLLIANDPIEFAHSITSLLDDECRRQAIGNSGRKYVETNHNWTNIAAQLESVYQSVINNTKYRMNLETQGNGHGNR
jgi:glycosyltransferase involved in cell wall biosynthesis